LTADPRLDPGLREAKRATVADSERERPSVLVKPMGTLAESLRRVLHGEQLVASHPFGPGECAGEEHRLERYEVSEQRAGGVGGEIVTPLGMLEKFRERRHGPNARRCPLTCLCDWG
jgi:hypothetical protein